MVRMPTVPSATAEIMSRDATADRVVRLNSARRNTDATVQVGEMMPALKQETMSHRCGHDRVLLRTGVPGVGDAKAPTRVVRCSGICLTRTGGGHGGSEISQIRGVMKEATGSSLACEQNRNNANYDTQGNGI